MIKRRQVLQLSAAALATHSLRLGADAGVSRTKSLIRRPIPSSGELVPVIGMGTSRTFDAPDNPDSLANLTDVMRAFVAGEGTIIDSSPMYGRAEARVGDVLRAMEPSPDVFAATKVWTTGRQEGIEQMEQSARRMGVERFDLIAVHNLQDWRTHLDTLQGWKEEGRVRYVGITTSHGRDHREFIEVMKSQPLDFVQFSYNIDNRTAEETLLPLAADRGIATMINRPYARGSLFAAVKGRELPELASEIDCDSWGQFFLKFIVGHPAVTCVIPATSDVDHMQDNMGANFGRVPDADQRARMQRIFESL